MLKFLKYFLLKKCLERSEKHVKCQRVGRGKLPQYVTVFLRLLCVQSVLNFFSSYLSVVHVLDACFF